MFVQNYIKTNPTLSKDAKYTFQVKIWRININIMIYGISDDHIDSLIFGLILI